MGGGSTFNGVATFKTIAKGIIYKLDASIVLMFHHITDPPWYRGSSCIVSYDKFTHVIDHFVNYVSCDELVESLKNTISGKVCVTFDDGLVDVYTHAFPYLVSKGVPFCVFIETGQLNAKGYITVEQLKELSTHPLVTIGSHTITHATLGELPEQAQYNEISGSKHILEELINKEVKYFAYPHGSYTRATQRLVRKTGYSAAFSAMGLPVNWITALNKLTIPRFNVTNERFEQVLVLKSRLNLG